MRGLCLLLLALCLVATTQQARGQNSSLEAQKASLVAGLLAQRDLAVIRERRLADDRQIALIDKTETVIRRLTDERKALEQRVSQARHEGTQEHKKRLDLETQVAAARHDFAQLAEQLASSDAQWAAEREAYRTESEQLVSQATPQKIAALQRFADGDREGAWPVISELTQASVHARMTAASIRAAVEVRQAADLREIMRVNGEATAADVLLLKEQAATLDPNDYWTQIDILNLSEVQGDFQRARTAATAAQNAAGNPWEQSLAIDELGDLLADEGDFVGALASYYQARGLLVDLIRDQPAMTRIEPSLSYQRVGNLRRRQGNLAGALASYKEQYEVAGQRVQWNSEGYETITGLAKAAINVADVQLLMGDVPSAFAGYDQALEIYRAMVQVYPKSILAKRDLSTVLTRRCLAMVHKPDLDAAGASCSEGLKISQQIASADSTNEAKSELAIALDGMGEVLVARREFAKAMENYQSALEISRVIVRTSPSDLSAQRELIKRLQRVGDLLETQGKVATAMTLYGESELLGAQLAQRWPRHSELVNELTATRQHLAALRAKLGSTN